MYDPASGVWTTTGPLAGAGYYHTATLLTNGNVLVVGGNGGFLPELYDPANGTWTTTGRLTTVGEGNAATLLPDGRTGELLSHVREERESLVIKPNRAYGGVGVHIGHAMEQGEWEQAIQSALTDPNPGWVVQKMARIVTGEFPVVDDDGAVHMAPFYFVLVWIWTRQVIDWMRLQLWTWLP